MARMVRLRVLRLMLGTIMLDSDPEDPEEEFPCESGKTSLPWKRLRLMRLSLSRASRVCLATTVVGLRFRRLVTEEDNEAELSLTEVELAENSL